MDPYYRKYWVASIHIHVNTGQQNEIRTDKIGGCNLERHVKITRGDVAGVAVDSRECFNPCKNRGRALDIRTDLQVFSLWRVRHRSLRLSFKKIPQPSETTPHHVS